MKVVFRVDASVRIGSGHLMRCFNLAQALHKLGAKTNFVCVDHVGNLNTWLQSKGFTVTVIPQSFVVDSLTDAEQTILALEGERPDWMVVDHYGLDFEWERRIKVAVQRILVIDDHTGRIHDCDVLLDQNYLLDIAQRYEGLIPSECEMLLGPDYALLHKEFGNFRKKRECKQDLKNILVFFTAGDDQGETIKGMLGIELFGRAKHVDVVVGSLNSHNEAIKHKCEEHHWGYHCQIDYMPSLIAKADLVVGAGGSSNWERCCLGVPALVTILAKNQASIAHALDSLGAVINLGWFELLTPSDYANALHALDERKLVNMSQKAMELVDALGANRTAEILLSLKKY